MFVREGFFLHGMATPSIANGAACASQTALAKQGQLLASLGELDSVLIAFSGGADSAYLAWAANRALGDRALAVTALSPSYSNYDRQQAEHFAAFSSIRHLFIDTREFDNPLYIANNADRCYHCKDELFRRMESLARERGFSSIAYGINADDVHDFRPGHRAAHEHKILAPLLAAGLTKSEIRGLSRDAGLSTWDRPASPCLSSRVPYGTAVTPKLLQKIELAEEVLRKLGFRQFRVRAHGELARVEIALEELSRATEPEIRASLCSQIKECGFSLITIDLDGYRQGSLNSLLKKSI
jgi:uncharacterized protein